MKRDGRIGNQESACMLAIAICAQGVFTLRSHIAYAEGNGSYIWAPLGILLACAAALLLLWRMGAVQAEDLCALYAMSLGKIPGALALLLLGALLWAQGSVLISAFTGALHNYVFTQSDYYLLSLWMLCAAGFVGWGGPERIARTAKCFALFLGAALLLALLLPLRAYEGYRLFPFPDRPWLHIGKNALESSAKSLPALLCALTMTGCMQGIRPTRRAVGVGACVAAALTGLCQLAVGLTYESEMLCSIYMPMFRLNMALLNEGYLMRLDKLSLFVWTMGAVLAVAYAFYGAARLICKAFRLDDVRPGLLALLSAAGALLYAKYDGDAFAAVETGRGWLDSYGYLAAWVPALMSVGLSFFSRKAKEAA